MEFISPSGTKNRHTACAVCRTDLQIVSGDIGVPGLPIVPGHQVVGRVAAHGPGVADDVAPSVDQRKAQATEGKIGSLIRDVHNRSAPPPSPCPCSSPAAGSPC